MVELQPSKLITRVRFPSPAPVLALASRVSAQAWLPRLAPDVASPVLILKFISPCGSVVEHSLGKGEVARSIRAMGTNCKQDGGFAAQTLLFQEKQKWQKANSNAPSRT